MKFAYAVVLMVLCGLARQTQADEAPAPQEKHPAPIEAQKSDIAGAPAVLKIHPVKGLGETTLQIPRKVVKIIDPHEGGNAQSRGISPAQTIIAGVALSAALGLGGLQLARKRSRRGMVFLAVLIAGAGAFAASHVFADRAPANPKPPANEAAIGHTLRTPAVVQIMETGEAVELNIDLDRAKEFLAKIDAKK